MTAVLTPIIGTIMAIVAWLVTAKKTCGVLDVACTGSNNPMLAGNIVALLSPVVLVPIFTLVWGLDRYDWKSMMDIRKGDDHDLAQDAGLDLEEIPGGHEETQMEFEEEQRMLSRAFKISVSTTIFMTLAMLVLWPMPMYASGYIFSKPFFTGWVSIGIIWIFCSFIAVGLFPIFEGRATLIHTFTSIVGLKPPTKHTITHSVEAKMSPGDATPPEKKADHREQAAVTQ